MKDLLEHRARRAGYDGWAICSIRRDGSRGKPWHDSVCTTREEAREVRRALPLDLFGRTDVVKVRIKVEVVS